MKICPIIANSYFASNVVRKDSASKNVQKEQIVENTIFPSYYAPIKNKPYMNSIPFEGVTGQGLVKQRGMLLIFKPQNLSIGLLQVNRLTG